MLDVLLIAVTAAFLRPASPIWWAASDCGKTMDRADAATPGGSRIAHQWVRDDTVRELVAEACRFVGSDHDVRGVHIVTGRRPTYREIRDYQMCAGASRVRLNVDGGGMISVRPIAREDS